MTTKHLSTALNSRFHDANTKSRSYNMLSRTKYINVKKYKIKLFGSLYLNNVINVSL